VHVLLVVRTDHSSRHMPNCGGNFSSRPIRPAHLLVKYPPSPDRVLKPGGCVSAA